MKVMRPFCIRTFQRAFTPQKKTPEGEFKIQSTYPSKHMEVINAMTSMPMCLQVYPGVVFSQKALQPMGLTGTIILAPHKAVVYQYAESRSQWLFAGSRRLAAPTTRIKRVSAPSSFKLHKFHKYPVCQQNSLFVNLIYPLISLPCNQSL